MTSLSTSSRSCSTSGHVPPSITCTSGRGIPSRAPTTWQPIPSSLNKTFPIPTTNFPIPGPSSEFRLTNSKSPQVMPSGTEQMYRTGQTRVEGPHNAHYLKGISLILYLSSGDSLLQGSRLVFVIPGRNIPGRWGDDLIIRDLAFLYLYPMPQGTPGSTNQSHSCRLFGKFIACVSWLTRLKLQNPINHGIGYEFSLQNSSKVTPHHRTHCFLFHLCLRQ